LFCIIEDDSDESCKLPKETLEDKSQNTFFQSLNIVWYCDCFFWIFSSVFSALAETDMEMEKQNTQQHGSHQMFSRPLDAIKENWTVFVRFGPRRSIPAY